MNVPIKIALVEDNTDFRNGLMKCLSAVSDFDIIADYSDCEAAEKEMVIQNSNVVLLDISLPGCSGVVFIKWLIKLNPNLLIIMLSVNHDNSHIFDSIRNGAVGYLIKSASTEEIIRAIREAVDGGSPMSPSVARQVTREFQNTNIKPNNGMENLTKIENEILTITK